MIEVTNLVKRYGDVTAVNDISFTIETGNVYGLLGPNGAGKSTTMNLLTGCLAPTSGAIRMEGVDITKAPLAARRRIGYLPENPPLYPDMTPFEYLSFVASAKGVNGESMGRHLREIMEQTGLIPVADRLIRSLSKGYCQRVGIAQAMLGDPDLIILDEPTVGLDPKQIIQIRDLIAELGKTRTVILSSHILSEVSTVCDRLIVLSRGRVVAAGTTEEIENMVNDKHRLTLSVRGDEQAVVNVIQGVEGVESCVVEPTADDTVTSLILEADKACDLREALFFAFADARLPILSMQTGNLTLEDIFLKLTTDTYEPDEDEPDDEEEIEEEAAPTAPVRPKARRRGEDEDYTPMFSATRDDTSDDKEDDRT